MPSIPSFDVRPGGLLVLTYQQAMSPTTRDSIRAQIEAHLPGVKVLILDGGPSLAVVHPVPASGDGQGETVVSLLRAAEAR